MFKHFMTIIYFCCVLNLMWLKKFTALLSGDQIESDINWNKFLISLNVLKILQAMQDIQIVSTFKNISFNNFMDVLILYHWLQSEVYNFWYVNLLGWQNFYFYLPIHCFIDDNCMFFINPSTLSVWLMCQLF